MVLKKISLHLNSNKPKSFQALIHSIIKNTHNIKTIEIIVNIDKNDNEMKEIINDFNNIYPQLITFLETDIIKDFSDAWKTLNLILKNTSEQVVLLACISDDLRFITKNWDKILLSYENRFEDGIYRLRCSKFKNKIYNDLWECGYAPDAYSFYSISWIKIVGQWCPCIGPDSFQECISFYMKNISSKYDRNIIVEEIDFSGESVSSGINLKTRISRTRIYYKAFFILMSYKNQKMALNIAKKIIRNLKDYNFDIDLNKYEINVFKHKLRNFIRRFNFFKYRGSPNHPINSIFKNILFMIWCRITYFDSFLLKIIKFLYRNGFLKKILKNKVQYKNIINIIENE